MMEERPANLNHCSCGCCSNGCTCFMHRDIPNGRPMKVCAWHASLAMAPLDPQYRFDYRIQEYVKVPILKGTQC